MIEDCREPMAYEEEQWVEPEYKETLINWLRMELSCLS